MSSGPSMSKRPRGHMFRIAVGLAVTATCLTAAFWSVPSGELLAEIGDVHYSWLAVTLLAQVASLVARADRSRTLLGARVTHADMFWAQSIGFLLTNFLPLRAGEAARALLVSRQSGLPIGQVGMTVLVENVLDLAMLVLLLLLLIPFLPLPGVILASALTLATGGVLGAVALAAFVVIGRRTNLPERIAARVIPHRHAGPLRAQWAGIVAGLSPLGSAGTGVRAVAGSAVVWVAAVVSYWSVIEAVVPGGSLVEPVFAIAAISLGTLVPASPGAIGVYELLGQQALLTLFPERYTAAAALGIALLAHLLFYALILVLGGIGLFRLGVSLATLRGARRVVGEATPVHGP